MKPLRGRDVWLCINTAWNIFNFRHGLMTALANAGFEVTAFAPPDEYVARIESLGVRHIPMDLDNARTNPILELLTLFRMVRLLGR